MIMKIGLTRTENPEKQKFYEEWLKGNDDIEIITLSADSNKPGDIKGLDGLILSGGVDIHPEFYGGPLEYEKAPSKGFRKDRDVFEIKAFETALDQSIPVLGICRGLQLINVALKGTLLQDLGPDLDNIHEGNPDKVHGVIVEPDTIMRDIIGDEEAKTNSAHHQSIEQLGLGLGISCRADDGTVEAIEWANKNGKPFLLAIQWHPERMYKSGLINSPASDGIRKRFLQEIKQSKDNKQ
jgi:putative glutamine amidotransferase